MRKYIDLPLLTPTQTEIVNGLLLGDGSLHYIKNTNCNCKLTHVQSELDNNGDDKITYMQYVFNSLFPHSSKLTKRINKNKIKNVDGKIINYYGQGTTRKYIFTSRCHPIWTELFKKWYLWERNKLVLKNNRIIKIIPDKLVLTSLTVCMWLMDDGAVDAKRGNIVLHTNGFTVQECEQLSMFLKRDTGILSSVIIKATGPVIYLGVESYKKLLEIVKPHIKWDCFKYKIDESYNKKHQQGEHHSQNKLTEVQVKNIIELYNKGIQQKEIADRFNVSQSIVSGIVSGKQWSHLGLGKPGRQFKKLSIEQKSLIIERVKAGWKQKEIANEFNVDQSTISKTLKNYV